MIEIGQNVQIIDWGKYYPTFEDKAKELKATKWVEYGGRHIQDTSPMGVVVAASGRIYLVDIGNQEILIEESGLKKVNRTHHYNTIVQRTIAEEVQKLNRRYDEKRP